MQRRQGCHNLSSPSHQAVNKAIDRYEEHVQSLRWPARDGRSAAGCPAPSRCSIDPSALELQICTKKLSLVSGVCSVIAEKGKERRSTRHCCPAPSLSAAASSTKVDMLCCLTNRLQHLGSTSHAFRFPLRPVLCDVLFRYVSHSRPDWGASRAAWPLSTVASQQNHTLCVMQTRFPPPRAPATCTSCGCCTTGVTRIPWTSSGACGKPLVSTS